MERATAARSRGEETLKTEDEEKEKRRGGAVLPTWGARGGALAPGEALVGAGRAVGLAALTTPQKIATAIMALALAASTGGLLYINLAMPGPKAKRVKRLFSQKETTAPAQGEAARAALAPGSASLSYLASANQGAFGAPKTADAPSASPSDSSADKAAAPGEKAAASDAAAADAAAGQAAVGGGMGGRLAQAFGRLTSSFGGPSPLRGGAGLSGGIGRGFDGAGSGRAPAGAGGGKLGGLSRQLTPTRTKTAVLPKTTSAFKGANLRRLDQMNKAIKPTAGQGNLQNAAQVQTDQWSSGQAQGSIGGAGAGQGQSPSAAGADSIGGPDDGGPIGVGPGAGGGTGGTTTTDIPDTGAGQDVTPWNGMVMMAQMMLMLASIAIMFIGILTLLGDAYPTFKAAIDGIKSMIFMLATGLAGIAAVLGIMIATSYGQATQGAILSVGGAITTACALIAYMQPGAMSTSTAAWMAVIGGIAGLAASIGGALAGRV